MKKVVSALLGIGLLCPMMFARKISPDAAVSQSTSIVQVIIQWNVPVGQVTTAAIAAVGGQTVSEFKTVKQGVYRIPASALDGLEGNPAVKYVSLDRKVRRKLAFSAAAINAQAAWVSGYIGTGIGVAVLDSGINQNPNLGLNPNKAIVYTQDFTPEAATKGFKGYGADWYGHGQHIAGIIASNGQASLCKNCTAPLVGIAPGASLINLKVLNEFGEGSDSSVIAAIDQAITLKGTYNIRVMNLSLGRPVYESYTQDPLCQAVEAAWQAGIVVVVAAGNDGRDNSFGNNGYGTINTPGNDPYVITVGAMKAGNTADRSDDLVASYSSKGPTQIDHIVKPDVVAPGNQVVSLMAQNGTLELGNPQNAVPLSYYQSPAPPVGKMPPTPPVPTDPTVQPPNVNFGPGMSNTYFMLNGTSMATAVVSGAVADILQAYPNLTPDKVKILIMQTSYKTFPSSSSVVDPTTGTVYVDYYDMFTVGAGYLDLQAALAGATQVPSTGTAMSPVSSYDPTSGLVTVAYDPSSFWNSTTVSANRCAWGAATVWSSSELAANQVLFGSRCAWGASADTASSTLWSNRCMWGASVTTAASDMDAASSISIAGEN